MVRAGGTAIHSSASLWSVVLVSSDQVSSTVYNFVQGRVSFHETYGWSKRKRQEPHGSPRTPTHTHTHMQHSISSKQHLSSQWGFWAWHASHSTTLGRHTALSGLPNTFIHHPVMWVEEILKSRSVSKTASLYKLRFMEGQTNPFKWPWPIISLWASHRGMRWRLQIYSQLPYSDCSEDPSFMKGENSVLSKTLLFL